MHRRRSLQWRITLLTALLIALSCIAMMVLLGGSGLRRMDEIGRAVQAFETPGAGESGADQSHTPQATMSSESGDVASFDPQMAGRSEQITIVIGEAQERFTFASWCATAAVTILSAVIAYFVSGRALQPLQDFSEQVAKVRSTNLGDMHVDTETFVEFQPMARSFNEMLDRLHRAFAAQRQFTGNAAHELRTPLALLQMQLDLFAEEHPQRDAETEELLQFLREQTQRLTETVKTLLEMSGLQNIRRTDHIALLPMVEEILTDLTPFAEKKQVALSASGEDLILTGSDTLLSRLFFNLVENAIKYNHAGGTVHLTVQKQDSWAVIRIEDTGRGIPAECVASIFQPFFRVESSRSREQGGVGLGLALAWEICRLHSGQICVEKTSSTGTVMVVSLPLSEAEGGQNNEKRK